MMQRIVRGMVSVHDCSHRLTKHMKTCSALVAGFHPLAAVSLHNSSVGVTFTNVHYVLSRYRYVIDRLNGTCSISIRHKTTCIVIVDVHNASAVGPTVDVTSVWNLLSSVDDELYVCRDETTWTLHGCRHLYCSFFYGSTYDRVTRMWWCWTGDVKHRHP